MERTILNVSGMTCGGCARKVSQTLSALPGVARVEVDLASKQVWVAHAHAQVQTAELCAALARTGFSAVEAHEHKTPPVPPGR